MEISELKDHGFAVLLNTALTKEFCDQTIEKLNKRKWEDALINDNGKQILDKETRDCKRVMEIDQTLSEFVLSMIHKYLPKELRGKKLSCLNPMFRYLKYSPGNYFRPHYDLTHTDEFGRVSLITVQIYLNDDFTGGETAFYNDNERIIYKHVPKKGDIILFDQCLEHAGLQVVEGTKYSVRTDVMYE